QPARRASYAVGRLSPYSWNPSVVPPSKLLSLDAPQRFPPGVYPYRFHSGGVRYPDHARAFAESKAAILQTVAQVRVFILLRTQLPVLLAYQMIATGHADNQRSAQRREHQAVDAAGVIVQGKGDSLDAGVNVVGLHRRRHHRHPAASKHVVRRLLG